MALLADVGQVEDVLGSLASRPVPLVRRLPRQPGQKEERFVHLLGGHEATRPATVVPTSEGDAQPDELRADGYRLRADVDELRTDVDELRRDLDRLRRDLGS